MNDEHYINDGNLMGRLTNNETSKGNTTMTQHNLAGLFFKENLEKHPEVFTISDGDITKIEQRQAARRKKEDKAKPPEPVNDELKRLRKQLFTLEQTAQSTEVKVNNTAGTIKQLEERINKALKNKKQYEDAGNFVGARSYEHEAYLLENELTTARGQLLKEQHYSLGAAQQLRAFHTEQGPRLKELQKEIAV